MQAALFAVSGAAKPLIEPFPNSFCSSVEAKFLSTAYDRKEAIVAPAPGKTPIKNPWNDCLVITGNMILASFNVILKLLIFEPLFVFDLSGSKIR